MSEEEVRALLPEHGFSIANRGYRITRDGPCFEYRVTIQTADSNNTAHLGASLRILELIREFRISPMGD
jgi:putative Mg2+ transporter-C (MgtC) family protein